MALYAENALLADLDKEVSDLGNRLKMLRTGRARPEVFESIQVEAYGGHMPLKSVANVVVESAIKLVISPWDSSLVEPVIKAIQEANLGYNPVPSSNSIIINIPPLTEESRKETVKELNAILEQARIHVRQVRQRYMSKVEDAEGVSEDEQSMAKKEIQRQVEKTNEQMENLAEAKEAEIMKL